ncbi:hypothetical protein Syun_014370 [Stephania yunnanensis]|uniref:Uncharacterized protein n=1 Tax=Stephania yunnanensis TaxID=152371 RepID=A0AAP0PBS0_9MAGN
MEEVIVAAAVRRICGQSDGGLVSSSSSSGPGSSVRAQFEKMIRDTQDSMCEAIEAASGGSAANKWGRRICGGSCVAKRWSRRGYPLMQRLVWTTSQDWCEQRGRQMSSVRT